MHERSSVPVVFVGLDWAMVDHAVCVTDASGAVLEEFPIPHTAAGIDRLIARLSRHGDRSNIPIGIERPDGRLVDLLLEAGFPVVPVKPNAIKTWREGEVVSGAKSDPGDAAVIAEYLRLRWHRLRPAVPYAPVTLALRAAVRARDDLVAQRVRAGNQLSAMLAAHWPGAGKVFASIVSPISLAFLNAYPTPVSAVGLDADALTAFTRGRGYSGKRTGVQLLDRLHAAPAGNTGEAMGTALTDTVRAQAHVIEGLNTAVQRIEKRIVALLDEHPDGKIFTSLPRSGQINAAQMLAEWGDCREAYAGPDSIAALAGCVPVTRKSGKHASIGFRWACNTRFRRALTTFADNSRHASPWAAAIYANARAAGKDHPHAVRILTRAWIRVIWRCWIQRETYDSTRHAAAQAVLKQTAGTAGNADA